MLILTVQNLLMQQPILKLLSLNRKNLRECTLRPPQKLRSLDFIVILVRCMRAKYRIKTSGDVFLSAFWGQEVQEIVCQPPENGEVSEEKCCN